MFSAASDSSTVVRMCSFEKSKKPWRMPTLLWITICSRSAAESLIGLARAGLAPVA